MVSVYLLRHGETSWNAEGNRYCGRTDINLTEKGIAQAEAVHQRLKDKQLDAVYSSPLTRALRTAEIAAGGNNIQTDQRIIEIDFGNWEGKTKAEFIAEDPASWENWTRDPKNSRAGLTGEKGSEIISRLDDFYNEMRIRHAGQAIGVVGHNGINRLYLAHKLGMQLKHYGRIFQENSAITFFELDENGEITLKKLNA